MLLRIELLGRMCATRHGAYLLLVQVNIVERVVFNVKISIKVDTSLVVRRIIFILAGRLVPQAAGRKCQVVSIATILRTLSKIWRGVMNVST